MPCNAGSWVSKWTSINIAINTSSSVQSTLNTTRRASSAKPAATITSPHSSCFNSSAVRKTIYSPRQLHTSRGFHSGVCTPVWYCSAFPGKQHQHNSRSVSIIAPASGAIWAINPANERPERPQIRIFCGLPIGVSSEPALTASASKIISRLTGISHSLFSVIVSGTTINSATSLVRKVESSAAASTINIASRRSVAKRRTILRPSTSK